MPKLTLLTATRRLGGRVKAESLRRFTRVTFPAHWQRGAPHPACCHQGMCPVSCCALWLEAAVSLRMRPWCAACGASHRHSSQPLRPQLLILVTSALSEWLCGVPGWGVWDLVLPMLTEVSGWACRRVPELFPSRGALRELGLGPEQRLAFKHHGWQASLGRPAGKLPRQYGQRCEAGSGTWSTSAHFKGQSRRPYCGGATKGLQSPSAG